MKAAGRVPAGERGFTLLEMVIAVALSAIILAAALQVWLQGARDWLAVERQGTALDNLRVALDALSREVREAQAVTRAGAGTPSDPLELRLQRLVNGVLETKTVRYYLGGTGHPDWLFREVVPYSGNPIAERIKAISLVYYPQGVPPEDVRQIRIILTGDDGPGADGTTVETLVTLRVTVRN